MKTMETLLTTMQAQFTKSLEQVRTEATRMDDSAKAASGGKIEPIKNCVLPPSITRGGSISSFSVSTSHLYKSSWDVCARRAREELKAAREAIEAQHAANVPLLENNGKVHAQVVLIMGNLGIAPSRSTYGYRTMSARKMTTQTVVAGFMGDLSEVCKTDDGYAACVRVLNDFEGKINLYEAAEKAKEAEVVRARELEKAERDKLTLLGAMAHKYGCEAEVPNVLEALLAKDKYLSLAHHLERTRNCWQDGPNAARQGLMGFSIESVEDQAIFDDLSPHIEDWDGDGRIFRDTRFSYDVLYGMVVDQDLRVDYGKLQTAGLLPTD